MVRRRGFLAEVHREMKRQAHQADQRNRQLERERAAEMRRVEQAKRAEERARVAASRAAEQDRKRLEKEAAAAHITTQIAEADRLNSDLQARHEALDTLLSATLDVDDHVDLEALRVTVKHPPFQRDELRRPLPQPAPIPEPAWPVRAEVEQPKGIFGKKRKLAAANAAVEERYAADYARWQHESGTLSARRAAQAERYAQAEAARMAELEREWTEYRSECADRERAVETQNAELDEFITALGYGVDEAVQEYVSIVLGNSIYPEHFPIEHLSEFNASSAELSLRVIIPGPERVSTVKSYRYVKASDEIVATSLSQKAIKDRYAGIVDSVSLRSVHEVFEADRRALIQSISLELGANSLNPATGREEYVPFVALAVSRDVFEQIELSAVVPSATLEFLGAAVSKNPSGLLPISCKGVRSAK